MKLRLKMLSFLFLIIAGFAFTGTPREPQIINLTDSSFTVVWYTDQAEQGSIEWGSVVPNTSANDMRGSTVSDSIHIIKVDGLLEDTSYYFKINSGGGTYLNNSQNYVVKTGTGAHLPGDLIVLENVFKLNSITQLVSKDVLVFARAMNISNEYSLPRAILYKNYSYSLADITAGYKKFFDLNSFRSNTGGVFSDPQNIELVAWTASEGFGFDGKVTIDYVAATFNMYLNTANLVFFDGTSTSSPVIPTPDPTSNINTCNGLLLEDFATDISAFTTNEFGGYNYPYRNDDTLWGYSILSEGATSTKSYRHNYVLQGTSAVYSGYGLDLKNNKVEMDLTTFGAIRFVAKGTGQLAVELEATSAVVSDYNQYYRTVSLNSDWTEYIISFSWFAQENWGTKIDLITALERMIAVKFKAYPQVAGTNGWFQIDDIYLVTGNMGNGTTNNPISFNKDKVITDFQNGTGQNNWGGYNYSYNDQGTPNYGNSEITMSIITSGSSTFAFVSYDVNTAFSQAFAGIGFGLDVITTNPQDVSRFSGIKFRAKGAAIINVEVNSPVYSDYNLHYDQVNVVNTGTWNTYYVYFTDMEQENWGTKVALIDVLKNALAVQFKIGKTNDKGQISIDDVEFFYGTPQNVQRLSADVVGLSSVLSWDQSIGATAYLVVRNVTDYPNPGSFPVSRTEGINTLVTGNTFSEVLVDGKVYYYSVFAYNDKIDLYSGAKQADKALMLSGGLFSLTNLVTVNETVFYSQLGVPTRSVRDGDYVSGNITLRVTVDSAIATSTGNITVVVKSNGSTLNFVTLSPNFTNTVIIPVTMNSGINDLEIFAIVNWLIDENSNTVNKTVIVADALSVVTLKPGSRVLCSPMPYNPNIGNMDIAYELTLEADVEIYVYNLIGQVVWKNIYYKGFEGGRTGYNQVSFNGIDSFSDKLAIGMYFIQIVHGKSVLGTSKFLVTR